VKRSFVVLAAASALLVSCGGDDDDDGGSGDSAGEAAGDYCAALAGVKEASAASAPELESGEATPEQIEEAFTSFQATFEEWEAAAPEEIAADVESVVSATDEFITALRDANWDLLALDETAIAGVNSDEITEAGERIDAYGERECGIRIDEDS
jgi:hypothetical protein